MTKTTSKPRSPGRLVWRETPEEDGSIGYWGSVRGHKHLCFSVWINAVESGARHRLIDLGAWLSDGDNMDVEQTIKVSAKTPLDEIVAQVPGWRHTVVRLAVDALEARAKVVRGLL